jgi:hypothetical protein
MTNASGTNVAAGQFKVLSAGTGDFSATNVYGIQVVQPGASYNGTLTNLYGLYIEDMTASSMAFTNEYNIYSAGATSKNYFAGDVVVSGTIYSEDILFGANTISGTGDIYCTDLYTAGSSVHIGDTAVISETGSNKLNLDSDYFDIRVGGNSWLSNRDDYLYFGEDWGNDNSLFWQIDGSSGHGNFTLYSHTRTILSTQGTAPTNIITELKADTSEYIQINSNQTFMKLAVDGVKMTIGTNDVTFDTDILFGANTVSGTGDIYCTDLYTAGGISVAGDISFIGSGSGMIYGEIFANNVSGTVTITSSGKSNRVQIDTFDSNGLSNGNITPDYTNDHITIGVDGHYMLTCSISCENTPGLAATYGFSAYKNNGSTEFTNCHAHRAMAGAGGDTGSMSMNGIIACYVNDTIEIWMWNENNTNDVIVGDITLSLVQIGGIEPL